MRIVIVTPSKEVNESIANHSFHLANALKIQDGCEVEIKQICKNYGDGSHYEANTLQHFFSLAQSVNESSDICLLQYHPDAYFGSHSRFILAFVNKLRCTLLTFCHSINNNPSINERLVVGVLAKRSKRLFAKSGLGVDFLEHFYKVNPELLMNLEFGIPEVNNTTDQINSDRLIPGKKVMLSTGYLSPEKGYDTVINAMPGILNHYPDMVYMILGPTDPFEKALRGDEYRKSLMMLAKRRGVMDRVFFDSRKLDDQEVFKMIKQADIYVAANLNEQRLSNDSLFLAVGAGSVILATPTWFAQSILEDERGQFFPFKSSKELTQLVINTMRSPSEMNSYRETAALYGSQFTWVKIGERLFKELKACIGDKTQKDVDVKTVILPELLPDWKPDHLLNMFDGNAMLSNCLYDVIDYSKGYSLKDNSMTLQVLALAGETNSDSQMVKRCLSFIKYMENEDGSWSSEMDFSRNKRHESCQYSEARTVWALGSLYKRVESDDIKDVTYSLLYRLLMQKREFTDLYAKAAALIGASHVLEGGNPDPELYEIVKRYANNILRLIPEEVGNKWQWYSDELNHNYGLVPLALAYAHRVTGDMRYLSAARRTCRFVEKFLFSEGVFNPAIQGHSKEKAKLIKGNDQDSGEAFMMVACYAKLYQITREPVYLSQLFKTHVWYLGENNLMKSLYDHTEGGCYDGLGYRGVSPQKGTESTCSYWLSHFTYLEAYFLELESNV